MIQILGLRPYFDKKKNKQMKKHAFFEKNWRALSVQDLFKNIEGYINEIPKKDRVNLFYTIANTHGKVVRDFKSQSVLPIDVDGCKEPERAARAICDGLGLAYGATGVVNSGNGLHLLIALDVPIDDVKYFDEKRLYYKALVKRVNFILGQEEIEGLADPAVFDRGRILRLPMTTNSKPEKNIPDKYCVLIQPHIEPQGITLENLCGLPEVQVDQQIATKALKNFPKADTDAVLNGCEYLKFCKQESHNISELQWYAMLSIIPHLEDGRVLAHDYSRDNSGYSVEETDDKIEQAMVASGPRTCNNIDALWDGCKNCKYFGKIKSPILIKGADYIRTKDTGFYDVDETEAGKIKRYPNYDDLLKYYDKKHLHKTSNAGVVWLFNDKFWEATTPEEIIGFAESNFVPPPKQTVRIEFYSKVKANNVAKKEWFDNSINGKVNFNNGVLNVKDMVLEEHSPNNGFRGVLPYDYDPTATCPEFDTFLDEITCGDEGAATCLKEYTGYVLSGAPIWIHKALLLHGEGANGKSTFMDLLKYLVGKDFYSSLSLTSLNDDQKRVLLEGKLVNLGDETHVTALNKSEVFKTMVSGGEIDIKRLYAQPYLIKNRAKLIFACNSLPHNNDSTHGLYRRLLLIPFEATFNEGTADPFKKEKLQKEAAGIFNSCMKAYEKVKETGNFTRSENMDDALDEYKSQTMPVKRWLEEHVELHPLHPTVRTTELYDDFKNMCEREGTYVIDIKKFTNDLKKLLPPGSYQRTRVSEGEKKKQYRGFKGIKLRDSDF